MNSKILKKPEHLIYVIAFFRTPIGIIFKFFLIGFISLKTQDLIFNFTPGKPVLNFTSPGEENLGIFPLTILYIVVGLALNILWGGVCSILAWFLDCYRSELKKLKDDK